MVIEHSVDMEQAWEANGPRQDGAALLPYVERVSEQRGCFSVNGVTSATTKRNMSSKIGKAKRRRGESYTREVADTVNATRHRGMRFSSATRTSRNRYLGRVGEGEGRREGGR